MRVGIEGFSWKQKSIINIERDGKIQIDPNDTVVIRTLESVNLSKKIAGTIHSIVSKVITKGLSDISTTIDPGYSGKLLISVRNCRDSSTELQFKETLCTACFYEVELASQANRGTQDDRDDLWQQLLDIARVERSRMQAKRNEEEDKINEENQRRNWLTLLLIIVVLVIGVPVSFKNVQLGASMSTVLAVVVPIVYDKFLKPLSKL